MSEKTVNYTEAQVARMLAVYAEKGNAALETLATELGKSVRSVVAKLSREGVYKSDAKASAAKAATKAELVTQVETALDLTPGTLASLDKATKEALVALAKAVA